MAEGGTFNGGIVIRAAIPGASDELCDFILWGRTPYPCGPVTPRSLFKAASAWRRAEEHGLRLCDWCHRLALANDSVCGVCRAALDKSH